MAKPKRDGEAWKRISGPDTEAEGYDGGGTFTDRLEVPGGYLYRVERWGEKMEALAVAFVPYVRTGTPERET